MKYLCFLLIVSSLGLPSFKAMSQVNRHEGVNHLIAIGVCPPWKPKDESKACENTLRALSSSLDSKIHFYDKSTRILVGPEASYEGVQRAVKEFKKHVQANDRVFVILSLHNLVYNGYYGDDLIDSGTDNQDALVLWTLKKPFTVMSAVVNKQWMLASQFRQLLEQVGGKEQIIIVDSCESEEVAKELVYQPLGVGIPRLVIASSRIGQIANFTIDKSMTLFARELVRQMGKGVVSLSDAFNLASTSTSYLAKTQVCPQIIKDHPEVTMKMCAQQAMILDPYAIGDHVRFWE